MNTTVGAGRDQEVARSAVLSGGPAPAGRGPRPEVAASWRRVAGAGLAPGDEQAVTPLTAAELEERRRTSGLAPLVSRLEAALASAVDAGQLLVVTDTEGRVLWRRGTSAAMRLADWLDFVPGSAWTEANVGTNAIGTSLVVGGPVRIQGAEHYVDSHTRWGCAAAPLTDPWSGRVVGVVDVSGPSRGMHPAELSLVELAARVAALEAVEEQRAGLERLRALAAPLLARVDGKALVVDGGGRTATAVGLPPPHLVHLPRDLAVGDVWLPTFGPAVAEALPGGWLLRLTPEEAGADAASSLELDLTGETSLTVAGPSGRWSENPSPRHTEILLALALAGEEGRTAGQLADDLFGEPARTVTVRAELSRIRRRLGGLVLAQPYRFAPGVAITVRMPPDRATLLPRSSAPLVARLRRGAP